MTRVVRICSIEGCGKKHFGRGWCNTHFARWSRCGDPNKAKPLLSHLPLAEMLEEQSTPIPFSGCIIWLGCTTTAGYGMFRRNTKALYAHRAAFELRYGPIPTSMMALHKCDIPACINPNHLYLGTDIENRRDATLRGRDARGERHGSAKLTDSEVAEIKIDGRRYRAIADKFGVTKNTVWRIKNNKTRLSYDYLMAHWPRESAR